MTRAAEDPGLGLQPRTLTAVTAVLLGAAAWGLLAGHQAGRVAVLLVLAPICEETVLRGGLQDALLRHTVPADLANALTASVFGLAHALVHGDARAFAVALPALLIGAVYQRTGRLRHCVALHALFNAAWIAWTLAMRGAS